MLGLQQDALVTPTLSPSSNLACKLKIFSLKGELKICKLKVNVKQVTVINGSVEFVIN